DNYLPRIVKAGLKVVLVDQLTDPRPGELVERGVSKIYSAGTLTEENTLSEETNNYLASIYIKDDKKQKLLGIAFADVSTGKMQVFESTNANLVRTELEKLSAAEIIIAKSQLADVKTLDPQNVTIRPASDYSPDIAHRLCLEQLGVDTLKGFGIDEMGAAISALGALINYLKECQRTGLEHLKQVGIYHFDDYMHLDSATIRNLELVFPSSGSDMRTTVYHNLNLCQTNMGKRKLYDWLLRPCITPAPLQARWDAAELFFGDSIFTDKVRQQLGQIADIERIVGRIGVGSANAKELIALRDSLISMQELLQLFPEKLPERVKTLEAELRENKSLQTVKNLVTETIHPEPPISLTEGGIINPGYNPEVDELRDLKKGGKNKLAEIQAREAARTGISSLKVAYNKVFGYYIEVTHTHIDKVPADYIRKQTLTNDERYITQELKEWEDKVLSAEEKLVRLEYEIFVGIRARVAEVATELLQAGDNVAELDVLSNFGYLAKQYNYIKPALSRQVKLEIKNGRHLVVERLQDEFTPNDVTFDAGTGLILLTGPNMSGKSTYIRQIALLTLLAQIGCFVPADQMEFSLVDRIFTRVGAADNLSRGESTFMVEMYETANILNNATKDSLIILDEVGRGTSTYDGVAIAWSIVEFIDKELQAKTLFATHYHELVALADKHPHIKN
ncbi:DNA mismatch repair protein MutS, partial [Candidatus Dojkabacteria bacterium]|nr:DNA mismatch repair protein MutS [Candidatus Dojkabacteria bacterium]